jgi:hypothetical protein
MAIYHSPISVCVISFLLLSLPLQQSASAQPQWEKIGANHKLICQAMSDQLFRDRYELVNPVLSSSAEESSPQEILASFLTREECSDAIEQISRNQFACLVSNSLILSSYTPYTLIVPNPNLLTPSPKGYYDVLSHDNCIQKGKEIIQHSIDIYPNKSRI